VNGKSTLGGSTVDRSGFRDQLIDPRDCLAMSQLPGLRREIDDYASSAAADRLARRLLDGPPGP